MPKSTKFTSKVPALADYKPSFLNEDGEITDVDAAVKAFHTLMTDKAKAQDAREDTLAEVTTITAERDELQDKVNDKADPDTKAELAKVQAKLDKALEDAAQVRLEKDRAEIAVEKGLTANQAKRLVGKTKDELEADADELVKDLGITSKAKEDDEDEDEDDQSGRTSPRTNVRLSNAGDRENGADAEPDYDKIAAQIGARSNF